MGKTGDPADGAAVASTIFAAVVERRLSRAQRGARGGRRAEPTSADRLRRRIRIFGRARLRPRALRWRADEFRMRERGHPARGFTRRRGAGRRARLYR